MIFKLTIECEVYYCAGWGEKRSNIRFDKYLEGKRPNAGLELMNIEMV